MICRSTCLDIKRCFREEYTALPVVCCIFSCQSINQNQFSSLDDVKQALQKANITLVNDWQDSSGIHHGEATIGGITFSLQFTWPLSTSGTIQLPSNETLPVSDIRDFTGKLALQVGINGLLPPLQYVGLGNFGFSVENFAISFNEGDPLSAETKHLE
ncbi:hypothetical protein P5673_025106 [Acropora cervicornis]|uniref:Uncharacterized protein n=1 Tax=Acropora cervicornis TaxID=6130 RepID=A0AAD9Q2N1_ACRCE|nr:hypothetical protein P5673_025106 [Acropora cervicornis]